MADCKYAFIEHAKSEELGSSPLSMDSCLLGHHAKAIKSNTIVASAARHRFSMVSKFICERIDKGIHKGFQMFLQKRS